MEGLWGMKMFEFKLSLKYIKANWKRFLGTAIGVIIAIAIFTGLADLTITARDTKLDLAERSEGVHHATLYNLTDEQVKKLKQRVDLEIIGSGTEDYTLTEKKEVKGKTLTMSINAETVDRDYLTKDRKLEMIEGRLPEKDGEYILTEGGKKTWLGESYQGGYQSRTGTPMTLVGYYVNGRQIYPHLLLLDSKDKQYFYNIRFKDTKDLYEQVSQLAKDLDLAYGGEGEKQIITNDTYISLTNYSVLSAREPFLWTVLVILYGIVIVSGILFIYNMYSLTYLKRIRDLGVLKTLGASNSQILKTLLWESTLLSLVSIPLGIVSGNMGIRLLLAYIRNKDLGDIFNFLTFTPSWGVYLVTIVVTLFTVYLATILSARPVLRLSPIATLQEQFKTSSVKTRRRKYPLTRLLFGYEGFLARRNINRNKKRYILSGLSLTSSIVMLVVLAYLMGITNDTVDLQNTNRWDFEVHPDIRFADYVEESLNPYVTDSMTTLESIPLEEGEGGFNFCMVIMKDKEYEEQFGPVTENSAAVSDVLVHEGKSQTGSITITDVDEEWTKVTESLTRHLTTRELTYNKVFSVEDTIFAYRPVYIVPESRAKTFFNIPLEDLDEKDWDPTYYCTVKPDSLDKIREVILEKYYGEGVISHYVDQRAEASNRVAFLETAQLLAYGFVILVTSIGALNVFNTIYSNMLLRKRELAELYSVGMTRNNLRKLVSIEGVIMGLIASLVGAGISIGLTYLLYKSFVESLHMEQQSSYLIPWKPLGLSIGLIMVLLLLATTLPLRSMGEEDLIETLKDE